MRSTGKNWMFTVTLASLPGYFEWMFRKISPARLLIYFIIIAETIELFEPMKPRDLMFSEQSDKAARDDLTRMTNKSLTTIDGFSLTDMKKHVETHMIFSFFDFTIHRRSIVKKIRT